MKNETKYRLLILLTIIYMIASSYAFHDAFEVMNASLDNQAPLKGPSKVELILERVAK